MKCIDSTEGRTSVTEETVALSRLHLAKVVLSALPCEVMLLMAFCFQSARWICSLEQATRAKSRIPTKESRLRSAARMLAVILSG
jgi:hypothetical protein